MNFSTNQVRQFYVVKSVGNVLNSGTIANPGTTQIVSFNDMERNGETAYMIKAVNALGEIVHSDVIPAKSIRSYKVTPAENLRTPLCQMTITPSVNPHTGDIFYLNFTFPAYISLTPEENMTKTVCFTYAGGTFKNELAAAINLAFKSNYNTTNTLVTATVSGNDVVITANEPKWRRGLMEARPNVFEITNLTYEDMYTSGLSSLPLESNSRIKTWGTVTDTTNTAPFMEDGKKIADLEYFCMGERGDMYRGINWPNNIETAYMVDPSKVYDVIDIHYYYQGEGINDDKSEKVITLVAPRTLTMAGSTLATGDDDTSLFYKMVYNSTSSTWSADTSNSSANLADTVAKFVTKLTAE